MCNEVSVNVNFQLLLVLSSSAFGTLDICKSFLLTLAYGTRARGARGSQKCAILSIICPFTTNGAFLCVNDVVVHLRCRKDAIKVFLEVNTNKDIINTVLTSSYT